MNNVVARTAAAIAASAAVITGCSITKPHQAAVRTTAPSLTQQWKTWQAGQGAMDRQAVSYDLGQVRAAGVNFSELESAAGQLNVDATGAQSDPLPPVLSAVYRYAMGRYASAGAAMALAANAALHGSYGTADGLVKAAITQLHRGNAAMDQWNAAAGEPSA